MIRPSARFLILFILVVLGACQPLNRPANVARRFVELVNDRNFDAASSLGTLETQAYLRVLEGLTLGNDTLRAPKAKVLILSTEIHGDTAICKYSFQNDIDYITMIKINKRWKVHIAKK